MGNRIMAQAIGRIEKQVDTVLRVQEDGGRKEKRERILHRLNAPGVATALRNDPRFKRARGTNDWFVEGKDLLGCVDTPGMVLWLTGKRLSTPRVAFLRQEFC